MAITTLHTTFLDEDSQACFFRGWNDPQIIPQRFNGAGYKGGWTNQLVPGVDSPYTCDTSFPCLNDKEYFYKVCYLLRPFKRGDIDNEKLAIRGGTADKWGNGLMFGCWRDNRARFYEVIDAAVEGCAQNGMYLLLVLFGFADSDVNSEWHGLFDKSDPNHAKYVEYIRDVRAHLSGKAGVLGIDIANEPDHEKHVAYWGATKEARMAKYQAWEDIILNEIDLGTADQCLVTIGHALGGTMFDYQWEGGWFITEPNKHPKIGFASQHPYWYGAPASDYQYKADRIKALWGALDKPGLVGEWGDFRSPPPAGHGYSDYEQWIDDILASRRLSNCAMRMWPRPNWPVKDTTVVYPPVTPVEAPIATPITSVLVSPADGLYSAKDQATGKVISSGSDLGAIMRAAFGALAQGRTSKATVLLQGAFTWPGEMAIPSHTGIELDGTATMSASSPSSMFFYTKGMEEIEVTGGKWVAGARSTDPCIFFSHCKNVSVHDVETVGNGGKGGVGMEACTDSVMLNNNLHDSSGAPLYLTVGCKGIEIAHNTVTDSAYSGIALITPDGGAETIADISIHHNAITRTAYEGIAIYPDGLEDVFSRITIDSNVLVDCGHGGYPMIAVMGGWYNSAGKNGSVEDCIVSNNECRVTDGKEHGGQIYVGGKRHHVFGNKCYNSTYSAIGLIEAYDCIVEDNLADTTTLEWAHGITVEGSCNNAIRNNQVKGANGQGIYLDGDSDDASSGNTVEGNTVVPVQVKGAKGCCIWVAVPAAQKDGITRAQSGNQILNNILTTTGTDYPTGIYDGGTGTIISGNVVNGEGAAPVEEPVTEEPVVVTPDPIPEDVPEQVLTPEQAAEQKEAATPTPTPVPDPVPTPEPSSGATAPQGGKKAGIDFGPIIKFLIGLFSGLFKKK